MRGIASFYPLQHLSYHLISTIVTSNPFFALLLLPSSRNPSPSIWFSVFHGWPLAGQAIILYLSSGRVAPNNALRRGLPQQTVGPKPNLAPMVGYVYIDWVTSKNTSRCR
ncbi:hypothetical protein GGR52DRAFT_72156 [Hypoxylon sp. FL1284]|nr:hypothetical protein GGR52DRAFT_72156 [Hypoxylon sp. FL1284]